MSGSARCDRVPGEDLLVVDDDPVVDPDDGAVPDRVIVGENGGVALGVVTDVHQGVRRIGGQLDRVEECRRAGALLVDRHVRACAAVGVADRVCTALCDPREQRLGCKGAIDGGGSVEAVSGYSAHQRIRSPRSDMTI